MCVRGRDPTTYRTLGNVRDLVVFSEGGNEACLLLPRKFLLWDDEMSRGNIIMCHS